MTRRGRHAVVIGAGFGGLAAALRLRAMGYRVTLCEALDQPGGRARVFRQDGFTFDAGPTVITAPYLFARAVRAVRPRLADHVELMPVDPFYRIQFHDGESFDYVGDEERLLEQIRRFNPRGRRRLPALAAQGASGSSTWVTTQLADQPFDRAVDDAARAAGDGAARRASARVYGLVAKHIKDERLRQVFTFEPLLVGGNPFRTTSIYLLIHWLERKWGVHYARGGTGALVRALVQLAERHGVEVRLDTPVERIAVAHGSVTGVVIGHGATTRTLPADVVVANADPTTVYRTMLVAARTAALATRRPRTPVDGPVRRLLRDVGAASSDGAPHDPARPALPRAARRHLPPASAGGRSFAVRARADAERSVDGAAGTRRLLRAVAGAEPARRHAMEARRPARTSTPCSRRMERRLLPGLRGSLVTSRLMTPEDFRSTLRSADGAAFGPEPTLTQSAWFRYHNRSSVDGLYFVGAGTHPGAGVPGVLSSAKLLERIVPAA